MSGLHSILATISVRRMFLIYMNLAFFSTVVATTLILECLFPPSPYLGWNPLFPELSEVSFPVLVLEIFLFNLVLSAFIVVTLPGMAFPPLSAVFLVYRGFVWGFLLHFQPNWAFLATLPTLVLEGEAYVFASVAGMIVGASWLKPRWVYNEWNSSRAESVRRGFAEFTRVYLFVVVMLMCAAITESVTLRIIAH